MKPYRILGLDVSLTSTGIAYKAGRIIFTELITPNMPNQDIPRYKYILDSIMKKCREITPHIVVMEDYAFGSKGRAMYNYGELMGIIKWNFNINNIRYITIPPTSLKKFVTGRGNASKEEMCYATLNRWGKAFDFKKENDKCDAFCLIKMYEQYKKGDFSKLDSQVFENISKRFE